MITVIVPVYNTKKWLERCVSSITSQSYADLEIILVDDGSTDGSGELCEIFARQDHRIKVLHQENAGAHVARWNALSIAKGEWISFVDSDDWIDSEMYQGMLSLSDFDTDMIWCDVSMERGSRREIYKFIHQDNCEILLKSLLSGKIHGWSCNKLYKRLLLINKAIDMSGCVMIMEDVLLLVQLLSLNPRIKYSGEAYYHYNLINESATTASGNFVLKSKKNIYLIEKFLKQTSLFDDNFDEFSKMAMYLKIEEAKIISLRSARQIFPYAHKKIKNIPLNSFFARLAYWIYFNTGFWGATLFKMRCSR